MLELTELRVYVPLNTKIDQFRTHYHRNPYIHCLSSMIPQLLSCIYCCSLLCKSRGVNDCFMVTWVDNTSQIIHNIVHTSFDIDQYWYESEISDSCIRLALLGITGTVDWLRSVLTTAGSNDKGMNIFLTAGKDAACEHPRTRANRIKH